VPVDMLAALALSEPYAELPETAGTICWNHQRQQ